MANIVSDSTHQGCQPDRAHHECQDDNVDYITNNMEVLSTSLCLSIISPSKTSSPDDQSIVPSIGVAYTDRMPYDLCSKDIA